MRPSFALLQVLSLPALLLLVQPAAACDEKLIAVTGWTMATTDDPEFLEMTITFRSNAGKAIGEIDASAGFREPDGTEIGRFKVFEYLGFPPGAETSDTVPWKRSNSLAVLLDRKPGDVEAFACVRSVVYADGTTEGFE